MQDPLPERIPLRDPVRPADRLLRERVADGGAAELLSGLDTHASYDVVPAIDQPATTVDLPAADAARGLDLAERIDSTPDLPTGPDLTVDVRTDPVSHADTPADHPLTPPDLPADLPTELASERPADMSPDLLPDVGPDLPPLNPLGAPCSQSNECASNYCVGGTCCSSSCSGACEQCTAATNGQCSFRTGTVCSPGTDCLEAAVCTGTTATCPARQPKPATTVCGSVTCSGSTQSASTCDGAGSCGAKKNTDCWPYACASGTGCKTSCTTSNDCVKERAVFCGVAGQCRTDGGCWRDLATNILWQTAPEERYYQLADAKTLCANLSLCGFDDWSLPDIDQLRSLVRSCPNTQTGGACGVTNTCLAETCDGACSSCETMMGPRSGCYDDAALSGPCFIYWSSSTYYSTVRSATRVRFIDFTVGDIRSSDPTDGSYVRCVRAD